MVSPIRAVGAAVGSAVALLIPLACSTSRPVPPATVAQAPPSLPDPPAANTGWGELLGQVDQAGSLSAATALKGFTLAVGPLPGSPSPSEPTGSVVDGTIALRSTIAHLDSLSKPQRAALTADLVPPARDARGTQDTSTTQDLSKESPYLESAMRARSEIAADLGRNTTQDIRVVVNADQREKPTTLAYSMSFDSTWGFSGPPAHCVIYVNPALYHLADSSMADSIMAHEVFHCFQADDFASVAGYAAAPDWLVEGSAEWVGDTLDTLTDPWYGPYLTDVGLSLFARTFDAVGFFAHMDESGSSPWKHIDSMLEEGESAGAYEAGVNEGFSATWASSLARQPFGSGWNTTGPGIPATAYHPSIQVVADGSTVRGQVAPYTNAVLSLDMVAEVVEVTLSTPLARLHAADGSEHDGTDIHNTDFCLTSTCAACPNLASLSRLPAGPAWLAITGDTAGASYTVTGVQAQCSSCPVGNWLTTGYSYSGSGPGGLTLSGGAGIGVDIGPTGAVTIDYEGMEPLSVSGLGPATTEGASGTLVGSQKAVAALPLSIQAHTGTFAVPTGHTALTYDYPSGLSGSVGVEPFGPPGTGTWTCSGSSMTLNTTGATVTRWNLARQA